MLLLLCATLCPESDAQNTNCWPRLLEAVALTAKLAPTPKEATALKSVKEAVRAESFGCQPHPPRKPIFRVEACGK